MFISQEFNIGFRDIDENYKLTNKALLGFFEDTAGVHSSKVGFGLLDIPKTHLTWFLISIRVKVLKRPMYGEKIKIVTWAEGRNKLYAFRNYQAQNEKGEILAIAASKWIPIDTTNGSIMKLTDEIYNKYGEENKLNFEDEKTYKIKEPSNYTLSKEYTVTKAMIDMQNHVHNTYYLNFVLEILPEELKGKDINELEILYKNQIFYHETVKILYGNENNSNYVVIKSQDENKLHAIIKFK